MRFFTHATHPRGQPSAPMDRATAGALVPVPAGASPKALKWGFWGDPAQIAGYPGTKAIPVDPFDTRPVDSYPDGLGLGGHAPGVPNHFRPSLYYVHGYQEHAPVSLLRTNNMPVPAVDPYDLQPRKLTTQAQSGGTQTTRLAQIASRSWHVGGRKGTAWPRSPQRWGNR